MARMQKYIPRFAVKQASYLVLLASAMGLIVNSLHPKGVVISFARSDSPVADDSVFVQMLKGDYQGREDGTTIAGAKIIASNQLKSLLQQKLAVVVDARSAIEFKTGHIPQAINIPYESYFEHLQIVESLPRDRWLVTYCDGPPCDLSHLLAQELLNAGFKWVAIYEEGLNGWKRAGLTIQTSRGGDGE